MFKAALLDQIVQQAIVGRCPERVWTDDERKSGFAERWEAEVLAGGK
jgi:hypothetical protein